jgi:hypothetical protein
MVFRVTRIWIQVLSVDYGGPKVTMDIPFAQELQDQHSRRYRAVFLNADVVGALYMHDDDIDDDTCLSPFHVLAFNIRTRQETNIRVVLQWNPGEKPYHVCPQVLSTLSICIISLDSRFGRDMPQLRSGTTTYTFILSKITAEPTRRGSPRTCFPTVEISTWQLRLRIP